MRKSTEHGCSGCPSSALVRTDVTMVTGAGLLVWQIQILELLVGFAQSPMRESWGTSSAEWLILWGESKPKSWFLSAGEKDKPYIAVRNPYILQTCLS